MRSAEMRKICAAILFAFAGGNLTAQAPNKQPENAPKPAYDPADRQSIMQAAERLELELQARPEELSLHEKLGILYLDQLQDAGRALPHLQMVVAESPRDTAWIQALARATRGIRRFDQAAELYGRCAVLLPADAWVRYEQGRVLLEGQRLPEAETAFRSAVRVDGKSSYLRLALAQALVAQKKLEEARSLVRSTLDVEPNNPAALALLEETQTPPPVTESPRRSSSARSSLEQAVITAYSRKRREDFARAAVLLEAHLKVHPGDVKNRQSLGFIYLDKLNEPALAKPHLEEVVQARPGDAAWLQLLAKACANANDLEGAARAYRRSAILDPQDVWSRHHLGQTLKKMGRWKESEAAFAEAHVIDSKNEYVRIELARLAEKRGDRQRAQELARAVAADFPENAEARAALGDIYRSNSNFTAARAEYQAALQIDVASAAAHQGLAELAKRDRRTASLAFYTFHDTDDLRQSGIFSYANLLVHGPFRVSAFANERFFKRPPGETIARFEAGLELQYSLQDWLQLTAGTSQFKTENLEREVGVSAGFYATPVRAFDFSASYRSNEPVNDSYFTARESYSQNVFAVGASFRPTRAVTASFSASTAEYSDDNIRRSAISSLAYRFYSPIEITLKAEYEWLDFDRRRPEYSSPDNYTLLRPVLEVTPRLTDWLKIHVRGELPYVFDEEDWGTGLTVGPRINRGDWLDIGVSYLNFQIPGGQTTWSGEGFKVDVAVKF